DRRQATEQGVGENRPGGLVHSDVVNVDVTGRPRDLRHIKTIVTVERLPGGKRVLEAPELIERAHVERFCAHREAHRPVERAVEDFQPAVRLQSQKKQLADLVGCEDETDARLGEPRGEPARGEELETVLFCGRCRGRLRHRILQAGSYGMLMRVSQFFAVSRCAPPRQISLPGPPSAASRPSSPLSISSPSSPNSWSLALPPCRLSLPRPPTRKSRPSPP